MSQEYYGQPVESVNPTDNPTLGPSMSPEYFRQSVVSVNPTDNPDPEPSMSVCVFFLLKVFPFNKIKGFKRF